MPLVYKCSWARDSIYYREAWLKFFCAIVTTATPMINDTQQLWKGVLTEIELAVSRAAFSTWFKDTTITREEEGIVYVGVPNEIVRTWLVEKYHKLILKALRGRADGVRGIEYIVARATESQKGPAPHTGAAPTPSFNELPLGDHYINRESNLNSRYTFDSFVVGPYNELAHAAAQAIIKTPGATYNPLYVYGETGSGKTHLIQAIGNAIGAADPAKKIHYTTSEKFYLDYINAVQANKISAFKEKHRVYDVFIMDDIQFFSKKEKTQEELFHLFNTFHDTNRQIVFSSDKHPHYLPDTEARLISRFGAGMIVEITTPEHESRIAILKTKARGAHFTLSEELATYLATAVESNIRELEGILNAIVCQTRLKNRDLSIPEIKTLLKEYTKPKRASSVRDVIRTVASFYDIEEASIYEKTRRKEVVKPRQLIMYFLREDLGISYPTIGQRLGGRDHTTVMHSCDKIKTDLKNNMLLTQEVDQLRAMLKY